MLKRRFTIPMLFMSLLIASGACAQSSTLSVSAITQDKLGQVVELQGTVKGFQASRSDRAPNSFKLEDASGSIRVAIWPDVFAKIANKQALTDGAKVRVKGKVAEFRGALEIHVDSPTEIQIEGASAPSTAASSVQQPAQKPAKDSATAAPSGVTPIAQLTNDKVGQKFTIQGTVTSARRPSSERAPYILKLKDATGSIDVVFWQNLADKLSDAQKPNEGDVVRVSGTLGEYRGNLQLKPDAPTDIQTQKSNPELKSEVPSATTQQNAQAGAVTAPAADFISAPEGAVVEVAGKVVRVERFRFGQTLTITDGKTLWQVTVWANASGLQPSIERVRGGEDVSLRAHVYTVDGKKVLVVTVPEDVLYVG
ncbi:MAG: exodeoxyribonuclease VII large subunit [Candidatus Sumerlaeaceae bacterium]|jgi:DNA/RNA endonuclease YhcR with UshA esterase domain